jgi:hypothetical protein
MGYPLVIPRGETSQPGSTGDTVAGISSNISYDSIELSHKIVPIKPNQYDSYDFPIDVP